MCVQQHYVYNKYIHRSVFVPCGHCVACKQQKANKAARKIRLHTAGGDLCLFVTLTYDNHYVPYIKKSDILNLSSISLDDLQVVKLPVYRDYTCRQYRSSLFTERLIDPIDEVEFVDYDVTYLSYLPYLKKKSDCVGVCLYSDVQKFIKRLRKYLFLEFGHEISISYYAVSEYGSHTFRPHFHLLIYFSEGSIETLRPVIAKAWPFGDVLRTNKRVQIAQNASTYVASYLNKSSSLPKILQEIDIKQKHSHSLHFGFGLRDFSLTSILRKVESRDFSYRCEILKDGVPVLVDMPIPSYVVNRYFPRFKGYLHFNDYEISELLRNPINLWNTLGEKTFDYLVKSYDLKKEFHVSYYPTFKYLNSYSSDDYHKFVVRLLHAYEFYHDVTGNTLYDFAIDYVRVWNCRSSYILQHSYDGVSDFTQFYINFNEFLYDSSIAPTLPEYHGKFYTPNSYSDNIRKHDFYLSLSNQISNIRDTNSIILSELYDDL